MRSRARPERLSTARIRRAASRLGRRRDAIQRLAEVVSSSTDKSIADVQQYWDARPCNIRHSPKPVGSKEYFDEVEARKYLVEPHIPAFLDRRGRGTWALLEAEELIAEHSEAQTGRPVTFSYRRSEARELVESTGFRVQDLHIDHVFPYRIRAYVQYRYVKEPYFRCNRPRSVSGSSTSRSSATSRGCRRRSSARFSARA